MVELSIAEGKLTLTLIGADKLWALKSCDAQKPRQSS